jgi:SulP family sulfate permease
LLSRLRTYDLRAFRADAIAGLTVALFTIPQAMAYALIAGFPPAMGIVTAVVASVAGALFGSSEFLVNGPTNAIAVMLAANAALFAAHGDPVASIVLLTLLIGVVQTLASFLRAGGLVRLVSEPVLTGFTAGAGVYIVINQLPSLLGIPRALLPETLGGVAVPHDAVFDIFRSFVAVPHMNAAALAVGLATVISVRALQALEPRLGFRLPAPFLAIVALTAISYALGLSDPSRGDGRLRLVRDIEPLTRSFPPVVWPTATWAQVSALLGPAFAIATLGAVEAIAIGKVLAAKAGHPFDASRQLLGEGVCNLAAGMVGGFASSGSFSRTAVNYDAGAETRVSVMLSGAMVLGIILLFAPLANLIPIAALAGTLVHIGLKLVDVSRIQSMVASTSGDRAVFFATFFAVLISTHLEWALFLGVAVAVYQALRRAGSFKLTVVEERPDGAFWERPDIHPRDVGEIAVLNLQGEMFFAAAEELERKLREMLDDNTRFLVVRVREAYNLDATMAESFGNVARDARKRGGRLILCGVQPGMYGTLERAGVLERIGRENVFAHEDAVLASTRRALAWAQGLAKA